MIAKDTKTLRELIVPGSMLTHMTGYVQPLDEWLSQIESEEMQYYSWDEDAIKDYSWDEDAIKDIIVSENRASSIGQSRVRARVWGIGPSVWRLQITMSCEKVDGVWKIANQVAHTY